MPVTLSGLQPPPFIPALNDECVCSLCRWYTTCCPGSTAPGTAPSLCLEQMVRPQKRIHLSFCSLSVDSVQVTSHTVAVNLQAVHGCLTWASRGADIAKRRARKSPTCTGEEDGDGRTCTSSPQYSVPVHCPHAEHLVKSTTAASWACISWNLPPSVLRGNGLFRASPHPCHPACPSSLRCSSLDVIRCPRRHHHCLLLTQAGQLCPEGP